jgi:hypothetical protein
MSWRNKVLLENKTEAKETIEKLFQSKSTFHKERAKLPIEKKIEILVKLQELANNIKSIGNKKQGRVWKI